MDKYMAGVSFRGAERGDVIPPEVVRIGALVTVHDPISGETRDLSVYDRYEDWTLMAVLRLDGSLEAAVFEDLGEQGVIAYVSPKGVELQLAKRLGVDLCRRVLLLSGAREGRDHSVPRRYTRQGDIVHRGGPGFR